MKTKSGSVSINARNEQDLLNDLMVLACECETLDEVVYGLEKWQAEMLLEILQKRMTNAGSV